MARQVASVGSPATSDFGGWVNIELLLSRALEVKSLEVVYGVSSCDPSWVRL